MKKRFVTTLFNTLLALLLSAAALQAQTIVTGKVTDSDTKEPLIGANIVVKGTVSGTTTALDGSFRLSTSTPLPFTIAVSVVGYEVKEVEITQNNQEVNFDLSSSTIFGQEVVISASRVEENILQSPVSVEKMDIVSIRQTAAPSFYDALANMKGVEMSTQSLTFRSVNTRGFNANGNTRVVQMIDGMDNQAPGLNFSVGNIAGISELDLESVELLPGAASALYGPNAINGILLMNSKSPFLYQGLSANVKTGIMNEAGRTEASTPFYDVAVRYAKAINDKFAFKVNFSYLSADDWQANDLRDQSLLNGSGVNNTSHTGNPGYNGVNTYGDETNENMITVAQNLISAGLLPQQALAVVPNVAVSRTGYAERDLADYNTYSMKLNGALHYKINDKVEALIQGNYGRGTTVYTGADRYSITDFYLSQIKAELRGSNFYVRAYTTLENSGDAYAVGTYAQGINEAWKPSATWFGQYVGAYVRAFTNQVPNVTPGNESAAHQFARSQAEIGRFEPGTPEFAQAAAAVRSKPIPGDAQGVGAKFLDKTNLYHAEFMYNFSEILDPKTLEIVVGANYRIYDLNSEGTLFATQRFDADRRKSDPTADEFNINEFGGYVQVQKKLFEDRLKLSGSIRYDKNENFKGQFSPRASAVLTVAKTHNFRASFQTGFRLPTTQDQYIELATPQATLLGGLPLFRDRYNMVNNPVYTLQNVQQFGGAFQAATQNPTVISQAQQIVTGQVQNGQIPNDPAVIATAVRNTVIGLALQQTGSILEPYQFQAFEPERVRSYEFGYKSLINNKLMIDGYVYFNEFLNFLGGQVVVQDRENEPTPSPLSLLSANTRNVYSFPVNSTETLRNWGWALGVDYLLPKGFSLTSNVSFNDIDDEDLPAGFETSFNTPNYRYNLGLSNRNLVKNVSFNITYRWQDELYGSRLS